MRAQLLLIACAICALALPSSAQEPDVNRRVLVRTDLPVAGYETVLVEGTLPVGGREGRHTHPGTLVGYVRSGTITLEHESRSPVVYEAGDSFEVEPDKIHEGINTGSTPVVVIATFIVEKGKPMTTQVN